MRQLRWMLAALLFVGAITFYNSYSGSQTAIQVKQLVGRIQAERARNVLTSCVEQNARHDRTIATLDRLLLVAERPASAAQRAQIKQSRASTVLLIEALVPRQDCVARVRRLVSAKA